MYGLAAIAANNGWEIALVGVSIVFTGIVLLSFFISQLHKIVDVIENPDKRKFFIFGGRKTKKPSPMMPLAENQKEAAKQFSLLTRTMADHFSLPRLLHLAEISGIDRPGANIDLLLEKEILCPDGTGYWVWDRETFEKAVGRKKELPRNRTNGRR